MSKINTRSQDMKDSEDDRCLHKSEIPDNVRETLKDQADMLLACDQDLDVEKQDIKVDYRPEVAPQIQITNLFEDEKIEDINFDGPIMAEHQSIHAESQQDADIKFSEESLAPKKSYLLQKKSMA